MDRKNRERKESTSQFYNSLAYENKSLLNSLRVGRRSTFPENYAQNRVNNMSTMSQYQTPYESRFGVAPVMRETPNIHHESVFINADAPQSHNQTANEVLDDLLNSYGGPGGNNNQFTLPVPQTSLNNQENNPMENMPMEDQPYNENIINTEENAMEGVNPEDSLDKLVEEAEKASQKED